jgi:eukaryotic-like serine/threonine-protein kinase
MLPQTSNPTASYSFSGPYSLSGVGVRMSSPLINRSEPLPGYKLLERLGSGGFGEVWKCEAPGGIYKAIKFVYGDIEANGEEGALAEREHKALERVKQVRHPFILSLERYDIIDGRLVILTELADCNLWDRFRQYRNQGRPGIPREELLGYLREAADALDVMNSEHQLQHLDIKPQNLFLIHKHIKVADFGMAKVFEGMRATITGGVTPVYASPETFEGWISRHCDQYSLAIVYQELLTGVRPFDGANTKQLLLQHLNSPPNLTPLPESDRVIIARSLAKKPDERYPNCMAMVDALQNVRTMQAGPRVVAPAPTGSAPPTALPSPAQSPARSPGARVLAPRPREPAATLNAPPLKPADSAATPVPSEKLGAGVLRPTVVIGLGWLGGRVLRRLANAVTERFGALDQVPNLRLLAIDTDSEAIQDLTGSRSSPFDPKSVVCLRLDRPSQYGRREWGAQLDKWLERGLLYRMPRNPATSGVRAFGRLALVDNVRTIAQRLQSELEAAAAPAALADADRATGLGLRSNRPCVFVVANLGGGAGSGMLTDLAYLTRATLTRLGYKHPEVTAVLLVPGANSRPRSLGNACAALTEILHFSHLDTTYELRLAAVEPLVKDAEPPFGKILAVPLDEGSSDASTGRNAVGQAAGILLSEILSPLGRAGDVARQGATRLAAGGCACDVAATYRFIWPRRRLMRRAALRLTERLLRIWMSKDMSKISASITAWLDQEWASRQLQPELLIGRLHEACAAAIGQLPDAKFDSLVTPVMDRVKLGSPIDAYAACTVLDDVFDLVGKPMTKDQMEPTPGLLQKTLGQLASVFSSEYDKKLAELAVHFIEQPGPRLACAEEAIRQLTGRLQTLVKTYESMYLTLETEVGELFKKLFPMIGQLDVGALGTRKSTIATEVLELLRAFPKKRYHAMIAGFALTVYRGMLGTAPEFLREVNYCRERLSEVSLMSEQSAAGESTAASKLGPGRDLFPGGHHDLEEAARSLVADLTPDDLANFDTSVQQRLRKQFHSLVGYCLEQGGHPVPLLEMIELQAEEYLTERLGGQDAAEVFFSHFGSDEQGAHRAIAAGLTEADPDLPIRKPMTRSITVVAAPAGEAGDRFFELTEHSLPEAELLRVPSVDDLVIYREMGNVALADLPPLSPAGREAYQKLCAGDTPPHARQDVKWQLPTR